MYVTFRLEPEPESDLVPEPEPEPEHIVSTGLTYVTMGGVTDKLVSNKYYKVSNWVKCSTRPNTCDCGGG